MKKRTIAIAAAVTALAVGGGAVAAGGGFQDGREHGRFGFAQFGGHGGEFAQMRLDFALAWAEERIGVTAEQEPQWQALTAAIRTGAEEAMAARDAMRDFRAEARETGEPRGADERLEMITERATSMIGHLEAVNAAFQPFYDSLTPEQQETVDDMLAAFGPGGRGGPGGFHRGHGGFGGPGWVDGPRGGEGPGAGPGGGPGSDN